MWVKFWTQQSDLIYLKGLLTFKDTISWALASMLQLALKWTANLLMNITASPGHTSSQWVSSQDSITADQVRISGSSQTSYKLTNIMAYFLINSISYFSNIMVYSHHAQLNLVPSWTSFGCFKHMHASKLLSDDWCCMTCLYTKPRAFSKIVLVYKWTATTRVVGLPPWQN